MNLRWGPDWVLIHTFFAATANAPFAISQIFFLAFVVATAPLACKRDQRLVNTSHGWFPRCSPNGYT